LNNLDKLKQTNVYMYINQV